MFDVGKGYAEGDLLARSTGNDMIDVQLTWYSTLTHVLSKSNGGI